MGNFSRNTFNALKRYVSVRLQQGVPLVDADWNEMEDIRKYELRAFLKWFVGDGVPEGNDGFRIVPLAGNGLNTIVLTAQTPATGPSSIVVDRENSTAADALGFGADNASASRPGSSPARLTSSQSALFALAEGMTLTISANDQPAETVTFQESAFENISAATAAEVAAAINTVLTRATAAAGTGNDFAITGGDGTLEGAGHCLVEGWDVINDQVLLYTAQPLFNNATLANQWEVDPLPPLTVPTATRTDTVYLDVWEREVNSGEDSDLVNVNLGIETCVRLKREWAVRVAEGTDLPSPLPPRHAFYPLAQLTRLAEEAGIGPGNITDERQSFKLSGLKNDVDTLNVTVTDHEGRIAQNTQQITDIQTQLTAIEDRLNQLEELLLRPAFVAPEIDPPVADSDQPVQLSGRNFDRGGLQITLINVDDSSDVIQVPDSNIDTVSPTRIIFYPRGASSGEAYRITIQTDYGLATSTLSLNIT